MAQSRKRQERVYATLLNHSNRRLDCPSRPIYTYCRQSLQCRPSEKGKGSPYSIIERRVPELIPVLGNQPAGDVSHKPGGRLPLLSARPAPQPLRVLLPILLLGEQRHDGREQFA